MDPIKFETDNFPTEEEAQKLKLEYAKQKRQETLLMVKPPAFALTDPLRLPKEQLKLSLNWANYPSSYNLNLILAGSTGVGKTRTAWEAITARYLGHGGRPEYIGAESFTRRLFREPVLMDKLSNSRLLLLDDLGKEKTTATAESAIFELIRARMDNLLPTIYTTNFSPSTLVQRFQQVETGEAIARRLKESSHIVTYE